MAEGPLAGVRILEFSEMIAAPFAGMHLGDLGADIIKVEPVTGEPWRLTGQFAPNESRTFISLNRNKRGMAIDLKSSAGQAVIHRLVLDMDVVLINYRPDTGANLGIDYETLRALNPGLIYVENTAMGRRGPQSHRPGYDLVAQAMTGLLLTGARRDEDGVPLPLTPAIADYGTGLTMAFAVCAALFARERTGVGQKVEATLLATSLAFQGTGFLRTGVATGRSIEADAGATGAAARAMNAYYRVYRTKDTMIAVACLTPALRRKMAVALSVPDPRHERKIPVDSSEAKDIAVAYAKAVTERFLERTTDEWLSVLDGAGVPAGPVKAIAEMADDVQVLANDLLVEMDHPVAERIGMVGPIIRLHETPAAAQGPSPTLGQHNDEILRELGYSGAEIGSLRDSAIIA
ncbi:MAG TPA: CoA transferase [Acidimicrobiales bacterium]|nr:CoA transferase [Acidimicrobiales bacterium]